MSSFVTDKDKLKLSKNDLFDRIINLKLFVRRKTKDGAEPLEEFIIRSDYEVVYESQQPSSIFSSKIKNDNYYIRRCSYKPSINFQYKRKTGDVCVELDIYISNFFIFSDDGKVMASFNNEDYNLEKVEVMMGYWGQFKDMPHDTLEDLYIFEPMFGADKITMERVEYVTTDGLPPDYKLHIHGFEANILASPLESKEVKTFDEAVKSESVIEVKDDKNTSDKESDMEQVFRKLITERFRFNGKFEIKNGLLVKSKTEYGTYGMQVQVSEGVKKIKLISPRDSKGNIIVSPRFYSIFGISLLNTMDMIIGFYAPRKKLVYTVVDSYNIKVYLLDELYKTDEMQKENKKYFEDTVFDKVYDNELPAIYNIDVNETADIVCPFFSFIKPLQEVKFNYRYNTSKLVKYYASTSMKRHTFLFLYSTISFATVDNINEVKMSCVTLDNIDK